jgi:cell division septal protein FtsQ
MRNVLDEVRRRYPQPPEPPLWRLLLRLFLAFIAALFIAFCANWVLDYFHLDPFGIRELTW